MIKLVVEPIVPKVGDIVNVRFGKGTQLSRVEGFTKSGKPRVRGFNASRNYWMPNLKTLPSVYSIVSEVTWSTDRYTSRGIGYNQEPLPELH